MRSLGPALRILVFPVVLFGAPSIALVALEHGETPMLFPALLLSVMIAVALLEHIVPYHKSWNRSRGDIRVDLVHNVVSGWMTVQALRPLLLLALVPAAGWLSRRLETSLWPTSWPLGAQLALAVIISEPLHYWAHRLAHERVDLLWSWHSVHHSARRLYWLNTVRDHPFGAALQFGCQFTPLIVLGCPERAIEVWALFSAVHGMLQHSNIDMRLGPFHWIFSSADLHRWHHSPRVGEANHNYGAVLIYCDLLFGTFFLPRGKAPEDPGIEDLPGFPQSYLAQLAVPFRWARIKAESASLLSEA